MGTAFPPHGIFLISTYENWRTMKLGRHHAYVNEVAEQLKGSHDVFKGDADILDVEIPYG
ncbi:MAG: hypothetical protein QXI32_05515 [Candidatus Bathyarchaeia archaeon]